MRRVEAIRAILESVEVARRDDLSCPICTGLREHCSCEIALRWVIDSDGCPGCGHEGKGRGVLAPGQLYCPNSDCTVVSFVVDVVEE